MEFRDLRTFLSVVSAGGVSRASDRLHLVQSAVSQAVKRLERELSVALLVRLPGSGGVRPTEAGLALAKHAEVILNAVARARRDMAEFEGGVRGSLNLGIVPTATPLVLVALIRALHRSHPGIRVTTIEAGAPELIEGLKIAQLDLVILLSPPHVDGFAVRNLYAMELVVVTAADSMLPSTMAPTELLRYAWVSFPVQHPARQWLEDLFFAMGHRPRVEVEVDTVAQVKVSVEAGLGLALLPIGAVTLEVIAGRLRVSHVSTSPQCELAYLWDTNNAGRAITTVTAELDRLAATHRSEADLLRGGPGVPLSQG